MQTRHQSYFDLLCLISLIKVL